MNIKPGNRNSKPRQSRGDGPSWNPADVDAASQLILDDQPVILDTTYKTVGAAQSTGYQFKQAVGAHLSLTTNDDGGYPALTCQTYGIPADFDADADDLLAQMIPARKNGKPNDDAVTFAAVLDRRADHADWNTPTDADADDAPEDQPEEKPARKPRSK